MRQTLTVVFMLLVLFAGLARADGPDGGPDPVRIRYQGDMPTGTARAAGLGNPFLAGYIDANGVLQYLSSPFPVIVTGGALTPPMVPAYRAVTITAAPVGDFLEIRLPTGTATSSFRVVKVTLWKPSVPCTITVVRRGTLDTGGTANTSSAYLMSTSDAAPDTSCKVYSVAPTPGSFSGVFSPPGILGTGDVATFTFGDTFGRPLTIAAGQSFALNTDTATTLAVMVEWE